MSKSKRKHTTAPPSFPQYVLDEYILLRRKFIFKTDASVTKCTDAMRNASPAMLDSFMTRQQQPRLDIEVLDYEKATRFTIRMLQISGHSYVENAKAVGTIYQDAEGYTMIEGYSMMSGKTSWVLIGVSLVVLFMTVLFFADLLLMMVGIFGFTLFFSWWLMYRDRNQLVRLVEKVIDSAEKPKRKSRLQDDKAAVDSRSESDVIWDANKRKHNCQTNEN